MRKYSKTVGALAAASTLVAGTAMAEIEGEVSVSYSNKYEFRFVDLGDDLVTAAVDIATEAGAFDLSAGAWYATWDANGPIVNVLNAEELDLYAALSYDVSESLSVELGYIHYTYPDQTNANTSEIYLGASYDLACGIGLSSIYYYDFDLGDGHYWDTAASYSFQINDCVGLDLSAGIAFADTNVQSNDGLQGYYISAALPWAVRESVTVTPYVKWTSGDDDLVTSGATGATGENHVIAGVSLAVGF